MFHWLTNEDKCIMTVMMNHYCNKDIDESFNDIFSLFGGKKHGKKYDSLYLYFTLIFSLIKIIYL